MLYLCYCKDKPNSLDLRLANRDEHLAFAASYADKLKLAGPVTLDDGETMAGSLLIFDVDTKAEVEAFAAGDPYGKAGLFESVDIRPFKQSLGTPLV
jgi:hypothetical protein